MLHKNKLMGDIKRSFEDVNIYELIKLHYRIRNRSKNKFRKLYTACTVPPLLWACRGMLGVFNGYVWVCVVIYKNL